MKFSSGKWFIGIQWDKSPVTNKEWCWAYVQFTPKDVRSLGFSELWYDGPIYNFGLWYINFNWRWAPKQPKG